MSEKPAWAADPDLEAFSAGLRSSNSGRWKKIALAILAIALVTFVAAYYIPLYRAHDRLVAEHRRVLQAQHGIELNLNQTKTDLQKAVAERSLLQDEKQKREDAQKASTGRADTLQSALLTKLDKYLKKGSMAVFKTDSRVVLAVSDALVFATGKAELSPRAKPMLCEVAKAIQGASRVSVSSVVVAKEGTPLTLPKEFHTEYAFTAARGAGVSDALLGCGVPGAHLLGGGRAHFEPLGEGAELAKLGSRVEFELEPGP